MCISKLKTAIHTDIKNISVGEKSLSQQKFFAKGMPVGPGACTLQAAGQVANHKSKDKIKRRCEQINKE